MNKRKPKMAPKREREKAKETLALWAHANGLVMRVLKKY